MSSLNCHFKVDTKKILKWTQYIHTTPVPSNQPLVLPFWSSLWHSNEQWGEIKKKIKNCLALALEVWSFHHQSHQLSLNNQSSWTVSWQTSCLRRALSVPPQSIVSWGFSFSLHLKLSCHVFKFSSCSSYFSIASLPSTDLWPMIPTRENSRGNYLRKTLLMI